MYKEMSDKPKRPAGVWAQLVATHMKAGGKFPKKGTSDYDELKKKLDASKAAKAASAAPAAAAAPAAPKARGRPKKAVAPVEAPVAAAPAAVKPKRAKKATGVPMPITDAPIANEVAALPVAKKPRTRKVAASKVAVSKDDEIMEAPAEVVLQAKKKMSRKVITTEMVAADALPSMKTSVKPNLVGDVSKAKGMMTTIPLARISGTSGIRIPFTDRLMPSVNPI